MSFSIVFHWGSDTMNARRESPFLDMHCVWPGMSLIESHKPHSDPIDSQLGCYMQRYKEDYQLLEHIVTCAKQRKVDPNTSCGGKLFIPVGIQTLHLWFADGEYLPWEQTSAKSSYWANTPPSYLMDVKYRTVFHGAEDDTMLRPAKRRRSEYLENKFKAKYFKHKDS